MKYCTAELYSQQQLVGDEFDDAESDRITTASEAWDKSLAAYEKRLAEIRADLPESVRQFLEVGLLHDADFECWNASCLERAFPRRLQFVVRQNNWGPDKYLYVLRYKLVPPDPFAEEYQPQTKWALHKLPGFVNPEPPYNPQWMYDEFDVVAPGVYEHNVLMSDGVELNIRFSEFSFIRVPVGENVIEH